MRVHNTLARGLGRHHLQLHVQRPVRNTGYSIVGNAGLPLHSLSARYVRCCVSGRPCANDAREPRKPCLAPGKELPSIQCPVLISVPDIREQRRLFLTERAEPARPPLTANNVFLHIQNIFTTLGSYATMESVFARDMRNGGPATKLPC